MLKYLHGISFRSFATGTGYFFLGVAAESYYHRNQRETSLHITGYPIATSDKMTVHNQAKTPFQVRLSTFFFFFFMAIGTLVVISSLRERDIIYQAQGSIS